MKPLGWYRENPTLTDIDIKYLLLYFEVNYGLTVEKKIQDAVMVIANENRYHPVCDFLNGLQWDGTERIRYCLHRFLGSDTDDYTYEASLNWARLPSLTCTGILRPCTQHKGLHPLYSCPNKLTSPHTHSAQSGSFGFCKTLRRSFLTKRKADTFLHYAQIHRLLHLTLTVIFSCGRLLTIRKWIKQKRAVV